MTRLLLVRHARPVASWDESTDAPLDEVGAAQARAVAGRLEARGPLAVVTSPLRRAAETAAPLARRWQTDARVVDAVGEVPSPTDDLAERGEWLRDVLGRSWADVAPALHEWRAGLLASLRSFADDSVVFTHFVAINVAVGAATGDERLVCCTPGHASVTELEVGDDGVLTLVAAPSDPPVRSGPGLGEGGDGSRVDSPL